MVTCENKPDWPLHHHHSVRTRRLTDHGEGCCYPKPGRQPQPQYTHLTSNIIALGFEVAVVSNSSGKLNAGDDDVEAVWRLGWRHRMAGALGSKLQKLRWPV